MTFYYIHSEAHRNVQLLTLVINLSISNSIELFTSIDWLLLSTLATLKTTHCHFCVLVSFPDISAGSWTCSMNKWWGWEKRKRASAQEPDKERKRERLGSKGKQTGYPSVLAALRWAWEVRKMVRGRGHLPVLWPAEHGCASQLSQDEFISPWAGLHRGVCGGSWQPSQVPLLRDTSGTPCPLTAWQMTKRVCHSPEPGVKLQYGAIYFLQTQCFFHLIMLKNETGSQNRIITKCTKYKKVI